MDQRKKYLARFKEKIRSYYPISDEAFSLLEKIIQFRKLKKNEILLDIGQLSRHTYFVCEGAMIAFFTDTEGNTYNKNIFLENQLAGSTVSALLQVPSEFTLAAVAETELISMPYREYKRLIYSNDELKNFYIAYMEKNWIIDKEQREISLVMESASARYVKLLTAHPDIDKRIPLLHIASHLGITPTQLSRIRKKLKEN